MIRTRVPLAVLLVAATLFLGGGCASWFLPSFGPTTRLNQDHLGDVLNQNPQNVHAQFLRGKAFLESDKPEKAESSFRRAISLMPSYEEAWIGLGVALMDQEKYKQAEESYSQMAETLPKSAAAHEGLASVHLIRHEYDQVRQESNAALQLDPRSGTAYRYLGEADYAEAQYAGAVANWNKAIALDPSLQSRLGPITKDLEAFVKKYVPDTTPAKKP